MHPDINLASTTSNAEVNTVAQQEKVGSHDIIDLQLMLEWDSEQGLKRPSDDIHAMQTPWSDPLFAVWSCKSST